MTSRDFGFLTLRNTRSYNLDDTYVADNYVFTVSSYGAPKWTNNLILNNLVTSSIETSSIKISSLIDRDGGTGAAGDVLHTDGSTAYWAPGGSGTGYWSESGSTIYNNNTGPVIINSTLSITSNGLVNANSTLYASTLSTNFISMTGASSHISTANTLAINASSIYYTPKDPTYIDAFKIELSGANFLVNRSTLGNISTTMLLNTGSGALSLGTNNPYLFIRGTNSGGNTGNVGIFTSTPQFTLDVAGNAHISSFVSTNTINMNNGLINSANGLLVNGPLNISTIGYSTDGNANLSLFNNKAHFATNSPFNGCSLELDSSGPQFYVTGSNGSPTYAEIGSTLTQFTQAVNSGPANLTVLNSGTTGTSAKIELNTSFGGYGIYACGPNGSFGGLTASTFQIYQEFTVSPSAVLTVYPNGDMNVPGDVDVQNLVVASTAITKQIVTSSITTDIGAGGPWSDYYGKYNFVNGTSPFTLTLPTSAPEGSVLIFRNLDSNPVTITNVLTGGSPLPANGAASFVFTQYATGGANWVSL